MGKLNSPFTDIADFQYRYGTRLRYAAITVNLTVKPTTLAFPDGLPVRKFILNIPFADIE